MEPCQPENEIAACRKEKNRQNTQSAFPKRLGAELFIRFLLLQMIPEPQKKGNRRNKAYNAGQ